MCMEEMIMKVKHELISYSVAGVVWSYYIRKIKRHWWNRWEIVMDGNSPQKYDLINGSYVAIL